MWNYEKRLQYPINITQPNAQIAQVIMSQYGGPDGEMGASMRYRSQRFAMPNRQAMGMLTDIGREAPEMFRSETTAFFALRARELPVDVSPQTLLQPYNSISKEASSNTHQCCPYH